MKFNWPTPKPLTMIIKYNDEDNSSWSYDDADKLKKFIEEQYIDGEVISIEFVEPEA